MSGSDDDIKFSNEDLRGLEVPHNDALVVSMMVANTRLDKIFCTTGFSHSIIYLSTLKRLGISKKDLRPQKETVRGALGEEHKSVGKVTLNVTAGDRPRFRTFMVEFVVMDKPSAYDIIFGMKGLAEMGAVISGYHLLIRFRTEAGIGEVRGSQQIARDCEKAILEEARRKDPSIKKVAVVM
ncbi:uncharacterized protein LOC133712121 [Rosa rugosa]|uniref:uncharacterized protein LOC133712121 n=1 Tax=Rosa rugosa TaxID=74645 RepID=UPI002B400F57|nr:uncharacterized protein LOC133712121 [Rosa rugosa]